MRFFPILDELFASDTIIFLLIGLAFSIVLGIFVAKNPGRWILISAVIYVLCELLSNFLSDYMLEFISLFVGTLALGNIGGFTVAWVISKVRHR